MSEANDNQPFIDTLPDELLGTVFFLNTDPDDDSHNPYNTTVSSMLVCRRWYNVAITYPALWSHIINYGWRDTDRIQELLRRSKQSVIDVGADSMTKHVRLRDSRGKMALNHIFDHAARIRTLNLQITYAPWDLICKRFLRHPAPNIEYLKLDTSCPFPDCLLPEPLFADQAPKLRKVHLQRCLIDFSSAALRNLTALVVMDILPPPIVMMHRVPSHPLKVAPTVLGWLRILENIPSLQYLTLSNAITPQRSYDEPLPKVDLPNLIFLTLGAKFPEGVTFLQQLTLPTCGIRLRLSHDRSNPGTESARLLQFLSNHLSGWPQSTQNRYLQAKIMSGDRVHFGNSRRVGHIWDMTEPEVAEEHTLNTSDPLLWLVLSFDNANDSMQVFDSILTLYEPTYASTTALDLWMDEEYTDTATIHAHGFLQFPSIRTLRAFSAVKVLDLLERSPFVLLPLVQNLSLAAETPLFPALRSLRLTRTNLEDDYDGRAIVSAFMNWRRSIGAGLAELDIAGGKLSPRTINLLANEGHLKVTRTALGARRMEDSESDESESSDG
ncbi:hypothetical protein D9613_007151 [Agrocybe pediades]|uniref:F-box domain-containing protein n=1 Tax=Agrocybe pediades TaxID=84607 RepID=A0A8H4QHL6_9AGAR|nr:hypothetical protein D9613_007151 [Agrocybe pediades]